MRISEKIVGEVRATKKQLHLEIARLQQEIARLKAANNPSASPPQPTTPETTRNERQAPPARIGDLAQGNIEPTFQRFAEHVEQVFWLFDLEKQKPVYVSPASAHLLGIAPEALRADFELLLHAVYMADRPLVRKTMKKWARGIGSEVEYRVQQADGLIRWMRDRSFPITGMDGNVRQIGGIVQDVTARKLAEDKNQKLIAALEVAAEGIAILDKNERYVYLNQAHANIYGYANPGELLGKSWKQLYTREYQRKIGRESMPHLQKTGAWRGEAVGKKKDGSTFFQEVSLRKLADDSIVCICTDISERKRAESALRDSEHRYRVLYEDTPSMYFTIDPRGIVISVNKFGASQLGYTVEELIGKPVLNVFHEEDRPSVQKQVAACLKAPFQVANWEFRKVRKDGSVLWVRETARAVVDKDGNTFVLIVCEDITDHRLADERLKKSEKLLAEAEAIAHLGSFEWDICENRVAYSNELFHIFGIPSEIGHSSISSFLSRVHPEDRPRVKSILDEAAATGRSFQAEARIVRPDGAVRILAAQGEIELARSGAPARLVGICHDVTERREAEQARKKLEAQVQHAQKLESLGVLAGGIAHDFNNLLTGILGNAQIAMQDIYFDSPAHACVADIERASIRAAELCKQLLAYAGHGEFVIATADLNEIIGEMNHLLRLSLASRAILQYHLSESPVLIEADAVQIRQVIMNLVTNAAEALDARGGDVSISTGIIHCDADDLANAYVNDNLQPGRYAFVQVADEGSGMDAETMKRIFDPFFTTKVSGRGLGLATVLGTVRSHGGTIRIDSAVGQGTRIRVLFPASPQPSARRRKKKAPDDRWRGHGTILIIDDEETVRSMSRRILERVGFEVLTASNGREGIKLVQQHKEQLSLVLLDLTMPQFSGRETFAELRRIREDLQVIMLSGYSEQETISKIGELEPSDFIQKPYELDTLVTKVRATLARRH